MQIVPQGNRVKCDRHRQREIGAPPYQQQYQRQTSHQHDIERQDVHIQRAISQQQRLNHGQAGLLEEIGDRDFFGVKRFIETDGDVGDFRNHDREQQYVGGIYLPDPSQDARGRNHEAGLQQRTAVNERRGVTGDEDENLRGIAEPVAADSEPAQQIARYMIDENQQQRQSANQIH